MAISLLELLAMRGPSKAEDLARALDVSQPTVSRMLSSISGKIIRTGGSKNTQYAAQRGIRQLGHALIPVWRVDEEGVIFPVGELRGVAPNGYMAKFASARWPQDDRHQVWFDSLPYFIQDIRPQGYMGRGFARHHGELLGLSDNPERWSNDDILVAIALMGEDLPGDLIVGDASMRRHMGAERHVVKEEEVGETYFALAQAAVANGVAGSSAAGEFPKFTATRERGGVAAHVIVKFTGAGHSAPEVRWADLLRTEATASRVLQEHLGIPSAISCVLTHGGRTFMETERFDRVGLKGRRSLCSLSSLDAELVGMGDPHWGQFADRLVEMRLLRKEAAGWCHRIWAFGKFIANSDMHAGNLSFTLEAPGKLALTPVYDMLPMRYAPLRGGELPPLEMAGEMPVPSIGREQEYREAREAAIVFWDAVAADALISDAFRAMAARWRDVLAGQM